MSLNQKATNMVRRSFLGRIFKFVTTVFGLVILLSAVLYFSSAIKEGLTKIPGGVGAWFAKTFATKG